MEGGGKTRRTQDSEKRGGPFTASASRVGFPSKDHSGIQKKTQRFSFMAFLLMLLKDTFGLKIFPQNSNFL